MNTPDLAAMADHAAVARHPMTDQPCTSCGLPIGDETSTDSWHDVSSYDAYRHGATDGPYHADCCPLPRCQLGGLAHEPARSSAVYTENDRFARTRECDSCGQPSLSSMCRRCEAQEGVDE